VGEDKVRVPWERRVGYFHWREWPRGKLWHCRLRSKCQKGTLDVVLLVCFVLCHYHALQKLAFLVVKEDPDAPVTGFEYDSE
jgi:hypothetical protein